MAACFECTPQATGANGQSDVLHGVLMWLVNPQEIRLISRLVPQCSCLLPKLLIPSVAMPHCVKGLHACRIPAVSGAVLFTTALYAHGAILHFELQPQTILSFDAVRAKI